MFPWLTSTNEQSVFYTADCADAVASYGARALTFKADGSVVQNTGEVVQETLRDGSANSETDNERQWPVARGAAANPKDLWVKSSFCQERHCWPYDTLSQRQLRRCNCGNQ